MSLANLSISYKSIAKLLLVPAFALLSVYSLPSGGFQFVDIFIVLIVLFTLATLKVSELEPITPALLCFSLYLIWTLLNCFFYFVFRSNLFYLKVMLQIVYLLIIFLSFAILFQRLIQTRDDLLFLTIALLGSLIAPFFVTGFVEQHTGQVSVEDLNIFGGRGALSFNNPNQLGYFAELVESILLAIWVYRSRIDYSKYKKAAFVVASFAVWFISHGFIVFSASRAAIGAMVLLDMLVFYRFRWIFLKLMLVVVPLLLLFIVSPFGNAITHSKLFDMMIVKRFTESDLASDTSRRVLEAYAHNLPNEAAVLMGSGKTVTVVNKAKEVHNMFVDIFLSYGFVGFTLFTLFIAAMALEPFRRRLGFKRWIYLYLITPTILYNMFHNGFRFRLMWVFLSLWYVLVIHSERFIDEADIRIESDAGATH